MPEDERSSENSVSSRRLEAFTDGVFAIAATLLVLDLSVDSLGSASVRAQLDSDKLWHALGDMYPQFLSFGISFLLLGGLWMIHTAQFEYVVKATTRLMFLNTVRLLGVVLIPFTTSLNSNFNTLLPGKVLLPLNFLFVTVMAAIQWFYVTSDRHRDLTTGLTDTIIERTRYGSLAAIAVSMLVVALAPFIGAYAFLAFFLDTFINRLESRIGPHTYRKRGTPRSESPSES